MTTMDDRQWALLCAVVHHGLANLTNNSVPCRASTVVDTASAFGQYLTRSSDDGPSLTGDT
jgi:hypothetical protein